jgi:hypothetical protein
MAPRQHQGVAVISHANMRDAAPLLHLLHHVPTKWREFIVQIGGTPEGIAWANEVTQWAQAEIARAVAIEAQVQMLEQQYGSIAADRTGYIKSLAAKYRKRAAALEQEAAALRTIHPRQEPVLASDAIYEAYRRRIQFQWKEPRS